MRPVVSGLVARAQAHSTVNQRIASSVAEVDGEEYAEDGSETPA